MLSSYPSEGSARLLLISTRDLGLHFKGGLHEQFESGMQCLWLPLDSSY